MLIVDIDVYSCSFRINCLFLSHSKAAVALHIVFVTDVHMLQSVQLVGLKNSPTRGLFLDKAQVFSAK